MKTVSDRIIEIKKQLDELEDHVNTTISVLDCKSLPLNPYPSPYDSYKKFEWRKNLASGLILSYESEEYRLLSPLEAHKTNFDSINNSNKDIIKKNEETFAKICNFFKKLGFQETVISYYGTGKKRTYCRGEAPWIQSLREQYKMRDENYEQFLAWYNNEKNNIQEYFKNLKIEERQRQLREELEKEQERILQLQEEKEEKARKMAENFLISNCKEEGIHFTHENAIEKAYELQKELQKKSNEDLQNNVDKPKTVNPTQFMEI